VTSYHSTLVSPFCLSVKRFSTACRPESPRVWRAQACDSCGPCPRPNYSTP
jgi:hypothetical protein